MAATKREMTHELSNVSIPSNPGALTDIPNSMPASHISSIDIPLIEYYEVHSDEINDAVMDLLVAHGLKPSVTLGPQERFTLTVGVRKPSLETRSTNHEDVLTVTEFDPPLLTEYRMVDHSRSLLIRDISLFSYISGILGAAAFMALAIGPGWLGFAAGFLPASLLASWMVSSHA